MNTEELLLLVENVQQSYSFSNSPVNYIADLLKQYFEGNITRSALTSRYKMQTVDAQLYFRYMPDDMRKENQRIFRKEFLFADSISKILLKPPASDDALSEQLQQCLNEYLQK